MLILVVPTLMVIKHRDNMIPNQVGIQALEALMVSRTLKDSM